MIRKFFLLAALLFYSFADAQSRAYKRPLQFDPDHISAVHSGDEVFGYIFFYKIENTSIAKSNFGLTLFDLEMKESRFKEITEAKDLELIEQAFDGETICLYFFSRSNKEFTFRMYDINLAEKGTYTMKASIQEAERMSIRIGKRRVYHINTLKPLPQKGFVVHNSSTFNTVAFDASGKVIWIKQFVNYSDKKMMQVELVGLSETALVYSEVFYQRVFKPHLSDMYIRFVSLQDGSLISHSSLNTDERYYMFNGLIQTEGGFIVVGEAGFKKDWRLQPDLALLETNNKGNVARVNFIPIAPDAERIYGNSAGKSEYANIFKVVEFKKLSNNHLYGILHVQKTNGIIALEDNNENLALMEVGADMRLKRLDLLNDSVVNTSPRFAYSITDEKKNTLSIIFSCRHYSNGPGDNFVAEKLVSVNAPSKDNRIKLAPGGDEFRILQARYGSAGTFQYYKSDKRIYMEVEKFH